VQNVTVQDPNTALAFVSWDHKQVANMSNPNTLVSAIAAAEFPLKKLFKFVQPLLSDFSVIH
jgi:hypothetical protein